MQAAVYGLSGPNLTPTERDFFRANEPAGYILFARNVEDPVQVRRLTDDLRELSGRTDLPILIDQEGGRVQRLGPPHWPRMAPAGAIGALYDGAPDTGLRAAWLHARLIAETLHSVGITVDCAPVLDLRIADQHAIIGDRAFSDRPRVVAALGRAALEGFLAGGIQPVIKHIPGHGRARQDSHEALPRVGADAETLAVSDFHPFAALKDAPWAMTAHILYESLDDRRPATLSPHVIADIIRGTIGFEGLLITDDLSMKALTGGFSERAASALSAGCDLVLHCNGDLTEMKAVAEGVGPLSSAAKTRLARAQGAPSRQPADMEALSAELNDLLGAAQTGDT